MPRGAAGPSRYTRYMLGPATTWKNRSLFTGVGVLCIAGGLAGLLRATAVHHERQLEQALKDSEREMARIQHAYDEKRKAEQAARERRKREGVWLCDAHPCNQGDLQHAKPAASGRRR